MKQKNIASSTAEAAVSTAVTERIWLKQLLVDVNVECGNVLLYKDNKTAILISKNNYNNSKCKNFNVRYRFINDKIDKDEIRVERIN